jgi:Gpi18-like mannosyltransferase
MMLLLAALALRAIIAYVLLPNSGFEQDLATFTAWALRMVDVGPSGFYAEPGLSDYPPIYMYVLWLVAGAGKIIGAASGTGVETTTALLKIPPILADVACGWLLYVLTLHWFGDRPRAASLALLAAALYLFNPVTWYDSAIWGQVDAIGALLSLATVALLVDGHAEAATAMTVVAGLTKPQYGVVLVPILAVVLLRRHLLQPGSGPRVTTGPGWYRRWCADETGIWRLVSSAAVGACLLFLIIAPFGLDLWRLIVQYARAAGTLQYQQLTVNALNPWALIGAGDRAPMAEAGFGFWVPDTVPLLGPLPGVIVGTLLLVGGFAIGLALLVRRGDRLAILLAAAYLCLAFFILPTRVHERYLFPTFAFLPLLAVLDRRYMAATVVLSLSAFVNLHGVLSTPVWATPIIEDFFFGPAFREYPVLVVSVAMTTGVFLFLLWRVLRATFGSEAVLVGAPLFEDATALGEPPREPGIRPAETTTAAGAAGVATAPASSLGAVTDAPWLEEVRPRAGPSAEGRAAIVAATSGSGVGRRDEAPVAKPGVTDAFDPETSIDAGGLAGSLQALIRAQIGTRSRRRDRSSTLVRERPGRIDRLDVVVALLLLLAALTLRGWRVEEPYDMYFDEVYHARTATEFLQDWRYGESVVRVYEYTHPHLAKYLIALGIVAFGDNEVSTTARLGFAPRDAAVEPRWDGIGTRSGRAGDRIYVSGEGSVRAYDLASRELVAGIPLEGGAEPDTLLVDPTNHRLLIADLAGGLWSFEMQALDDVRAGDDPATMAPATFVGELGGPARTMIADDAGERLTAALDGGRVVVFDLLEGMRLAEEEVPGAADLASANGGQQLVLDTTDLTDPGAVAATLAAILDDDAARIRQLLVGTEGIVTVVGTLDSEEATNVQEAIDAGELPGASIESRELVAVAATEGLVLLDAETLDRMDAFLTDTPVSAVEKVEGPAAPSLYATSGSRLLRLEISEGLEPSQQKDVWMPAPVRDLVFDPATQLIHVLGDAPNRGGPTVYVVEPHGNVVFADAPLAAEPIAWALDADPDRPTQDREQLLAISASGVMSAIETGQNAFGWRFPGVILGAFTAALLYLLARVLVRRREVALAVAALVLVDGMTFAQARIAMNDVHVGVFIVAAYLLFAMVWLGTWRGWSALLIGLPLIGLCLGLAVAAKWVGLYAVGGIVLLILLRSVIGRVLALVAMIGMTGVLGWLAVSSPSSSSTDTMGIVLVTTLVTAGCAIGLRLLRATTMLLVVGSAFAAIATAVLLLMPGNGIFLVIMIGLTLLLAVAMILRPIRCSLDEARFAVGAPAVFGILGASAAIIASSRLPTEGLITSTTLLAASLGLVAVSVLAYTIFALAGARGLGPWAKAPPEPAAGEEAAGSAGGPVSPPARGWLRPGWRLGAPWLWAMACVVAIPIVVYVASYWPWVQLGNLWFAGFPADHTDPLAQTFWDLQQQMYAYHNNLRVPHAATSPWWAWPFDLKPVWFYLGSLAEGWTALTYDAGNLVLFWLSVPAMAWVALMAWRRRSLALALVMIGFACQWLPWARIDRATFQYHYYTSLPFVILAFAYFVAELWHGPSARTWLLARVAAAAALVAVPLLWLLRVPLCAVSGVAQVNPGSQACGYVSEAFVLTERVAVSMVIVLVGLVVLAWQAHTLGLRRRRSELEAEHEGRLPAGSIWLLVTAVTTGVALAIVQTRFPETPLIAAPIGDLGPYVGALLLGLPLAVAGWLVLGARDPRRFVIGTLGAMAIWFAVFQPNIAALPVPTGIAHLFQTLPLPTYNYDFQFAVNTAEATQTSVVSLESIALTAMVAFLAGAAMYTASAWRAGRSEAVLEASPAEPEPARR